jgi:hypothetical protein
VSTRDSFRDLPEKFFPEDPDGRARFQQLLDDLLYKSELQLKMAQDFPNSYTGSGGYNLQVNTAENAVEFNPVVQSDTNIYGTRYTFINSEWLYSIGGLQKINLVTATATEVWDTDSYYDGYTTASLSLFIVPVTRYGVYTIEVSQIGQLAEEDEGGDLTPVGPTLACDPRCDTYGYSELRIDAGGQFAIVRSNMNVDDWHIVDRVYSYNFAALTTRMYASTDPNYILIRTNHFCREFPLGNADGVLESFYVSVTRLGDVPS